MDKFQRSEKFKNVVALWSRSCLHTVFKRMSKDILTVNSNFPLDHFPSTEYVLALQDREAGATKVAESEKSGSGTTLLRGGGPFFFSKRRARNLG